MTNALNYQSIVLVALEILKLNKLIIILRVTGCQIWRVGERIS